MKHEQWLLNLLPQWREEGIITPEAEAVLRQRHTPDERKTPLWFVFLGSLGALLVGLGIITLFAANWEAFGRPARAALSFAPLCLSLAAYGAGLWRGWDKKTGFLDTTAILWALSVGACIALIAQTYQISSDGRSFVLAWTLLLLPVMYATRSFVVTAGHYAGLVIWMGMTHGLGMQQVWALALALPGLPVALDIMAARPEEKARGIVLRWMMVAAGCVAYGFLFNTKNYYGGGFGCFMYVVLFAAMAQIEFARDNGGEWWKKPWGIVGTLGLLSAVAGFAFGELDAVKVFDVGQWPEYHFSVMGAMCLLLAVLCARSALRWRASPKKMFYPLAFGVAPIFCLLTFEDLHIVAFAYLAALGIVALVSGISERRLGRANLGLLVLLACILQKFFASDLPLTAKAVVFIISGAAFFAFSFHMNRVMRNGRNGK
jgi:hypothetical protein